MEFAGVKGNNSICNKGDILFECDTFDGVALKEGVIYHLTADTSYRGEEFLKGYYQYDGTSILPFGSGSGGSAGYMISEIFTNDKWQQDGDEYTYTLTHHGVVNGIYILVDTKYILTANIGVELINNTITLRSPAAFTGKVQLLIIKDIAGGNTLADYGIVDAYTKTETDSKLIWETGSGEHSAQTKETLCSAEGSYSVAEGYDSIAMANNSHAEGNACKIFAEAVSAHAEGIGSNARGIASHVEGQQSTARGDCSHAEGGATTSAGDYSHAEGNNTITNNNYEHAEGHFNISTKTSDVYGNAGNTMSSIGIGNSLMNRKNAVEVMQNGDTYILGVGEYDGTNFASATTVQTVVNNKQDKLTAGDGIKIEDNVISANELIDGGTF